MKNILKYVFITLVFALLVVGIGYYLPSNPPTKTSEPFSNSEPEKLLDEDYIKNLGLMQGHLIAAKDLLNGGTPDQAQSHLEHPIEELYGEIKDKLKEEGVDNFKQNLEELYDIAKYNPYSQDVTEKLGKSVVNIESAIDRFFEKNNNLQSPEFAEKVLISILNTASEEYEAAIGRNCKIVAPIEYQDSFGFVKYVKNKLSEKSWVPDQTREKMKSDVKNLLKAWSPDKDKPFKGKEIEPPNCLEALSPSGEKASVYPPEYPVMTPAQLSEEIAKISK
ncbi:MAG: hypothetical protein F6K50_26830 [Moorea sp. SIO3I7]|nr:hypothetical protein [Moorena sp. SIO3I7]